MLQLTAGAATQCSQSTGRLRVRNKSAAKSASILPRKAGNAPPCRRGPSPCLAAAEKDTKQEPNLVVPDAPPGKGSTAEGAQTSTSEVQGASSQPDTERLSADEIREQMAQLRAAAKEEEKKDGFVQGVLEEVQLIKWPTPQSALLNTLLVIAIVAATSVVLFGVNTALAELSRQVYTRF